MKYKMLVLDMDDTLLTDDHLISEKNKEMLLQAQELGVYVVLASGRPTPAMEKYAQELHLAKYGSYMLAYNGAVIKRMSDSKILFEQSLTQTEIHELYDFSVANNTRIITYINDEIICESDCPYAELEAHITQMPLRRVESFKNAVDQSAIKCILLQDPEVLIGVQDTLRAAMPHKAVTTSKPFFLEVTQKGIDKAASLARLGKELGIDASEMIAVGNAHNDLSMIEFAGLGVWVDNVHPDLRAKGDVIVASNNNDGVAEVVEKYILN